MRDDARRAGLDRAEGAGKSRDRRYETANGFVMDVQRHLADEPVLACPPSTAYRLRKFVRRNKAALVTGFLVMATLAVGAGGRFPNLSANAAGGPVRREIFAALVEAQDQEMPVAESRREIARIEPAPRPQA